MREDHVGNIYTRDQSYFLLVNDSNKGFKSVFFNVRAMISAAKRSIVDFENGHMVREKFPFCWTGEHFNWDGSAYALKLRLLNGKDAVSFNLLKLWADKFVVGWKIECAIVIEAMVDAC